MTETPAQHRTRADVVVVGAGIVGCSAAWHLARAGAEVILLDKGEVAFEQSSRNWGWVRQVGRDLRELPMAQLSRRLWSTLEEETGASIGWASEGNLHLGYSREEMKVFEEWSRAARNLDLDTEVVGRQDADNLFPGLDDEHVGGIFSPLDGGADPHRAAPAIASAAEREGARIHTGCAVRSFERSGRRITALQTETGRIETSTVVVAAGAWSSRLLWPLGVHLPQRRIHATVSATAPMPVTTRRIVWARHLAMRPDHEGSFILAGGGGRVPADLETLRFRALFRGSELDTSRREEVHLGFGREALRDAAAALRGGSKAIWSRVRAEEPPPDPTSVAQAQARFRKIYRPAHAATESRRWAGYIDYTPDAVPVIDRPVEVPGLVVATGFSGHGFMLGPAGGLLAAELALGKETSVDLHSLRLSRFAEGADERQLHF